MKNKFTRRSVGAVAAVALLAVSASVIATAGAGTSGSSDAATTAKKPLKLEDASIFIELNGTDGDTGLHMELGGEAWKKLQVTSPKNKRILDIKVKSNLATQGLAGVFIESAEPSFKELSLKQFKKRFPEGKYRVKGTTLKARTLTGTDKLTHDIPREPAVTAPVDGGTVDPNGFVFSWEADTDPKVEIVRYQLTVSNEDKPNGEVIIEVGPNVTSATIDGEYLSPGDTYAAELIALERSGNQTIAALEFTTSG